jgi:hypothetical protein
VGSNGTFPLPDGITVNFRPAKMTLPTTYLYNASIQHQITDRVAVTASYVGNSNRHGFIGTGQTINPNQAPFVIGANDTNANRPYFSKYGWTQDLSYYCNCANEQYNSLQMTFKVNAWQGWTMQGSYTYQRQWGPGWGYDSNYYFLYDQVDGQGYSNTMPRNAWIFAQNYDVPFGRGRRYGGDVNRFVDLALGGWTLSGITTYYSGFGFSPTLEDYPGKPNAGPNNRPNIGSGDPFAGAQGNRNQWFVGGVGSTFLLPSANTFGNYPINVLFGPRFIQQDLSLGKTFQLTERFSFQLKADAQNAFNHTNLGSPNSDVQSPNAGQITGIAGGGVMRRLQLSGTIRF